MRPSGVPLTLVVAATVGLGGACATAPGGPKRITADIPTATVAGNTFVAPAGWSLTVRGPATILEAPEGGSFIALVDVAAADAVDGDAAVAAAWAAYKPDATWPLKVTTPVADKDGWTDRKSYSYRTSPNEKRDVGADARRANDRWTVAIYDYGMGLFVNTQYGTPVIHHGGDMIGFHSDMMWLPEHGVGAVILTNGDPGWLVRSVFRRKLLEVLFDGEAEADGQIAATAKTFFDEMAADRKLLTVPADPSEAGKLAARYAHPAVGAIAVSKKGPATIFDFGEWSSEAASRKNPDGTISFITIVPGFIGLEFVVGDNTLTLRDAQHEYVFAGLALPTSATR